MDKRQKASITRVVQKAIVNTSLQESIINTGLQGEKSKPSRCGVLILPDLQEAILQKWLYWHQRKRYTH